MPELTLKEIMVIVETAMNISEKANLEVEVISTAFNSIIKNPKLSIDDALNNAIEEWIKQNKLFISGKPKNTINSNKTKKYYGLSY